MEIASLTLRGRKFTKYANKMLGRSIIRSSGHSVKLFDRDTFLFQVVTRKVGRKGGNSQTSRIKESMCSCKKCSNYRIPCSHVTACCAYLSLNHEMYVRDYYKLENVLKVYNGIFEPIPNKGK